MEYDPLVTMATKRVKPKVVSALEILGSATLHELAVGIDEDDSIVAGTLKRMADDGEVVLDVANRRVQLA